ncbi:MAG: 30S ribosomal protein S6 [Alphaproteobacteria bacterium]|nr:30S ribosomal protein S6 [Alphaproteobacteria bacterium]
MAFLRDFSLVKKMRLYENIFIGRQDLSQQQIEALGVSLGMLVTQNGGEVVRSEYCGLRNLAYQIKKNHKGHYYIIQMKATSAIVAELNRTMRINEDIIRHLIVKVDAFENKDNLISQAKSYNDDFGGAATKDIGYRAANSKIDMLKGSEAEEVVESTTSEVEE